MIGGVTVTQEHKGPRLYIVNKRNLGDLEAEYEYENIYK